METGAALRELGAATLGECGARIMHSRVRPIWPGAGLAAQAVPVRCAPADNLAIHVAVATASAGKVLVVDVGDVLERGYWGEVLTTGAQARGLAGLVIDGGIRDVTAIETHRFPVFASMIALTGAAKTSAGSVGIPTEVAGAMVEPGDWVVGDADGVVIVPAASLDQVISAGRARAEKEQGYFSALQGGTTTVELLGLDTSKIDVADLGTPS